MEMSRQASSLVETDSQLSEELLNAQSLEDKVAADILQSESSTGLNPSIRTSDGKISEGSLACEHLDISVMF